MVSRSLSLVPLCLTYSHHWSASTIKQFPSCQPQESPANALREETERILSSGESMSAGSSAVSMPVLMWWTPFSMTKVGNGSWVWMTRVIWVNLVDFLDSFSNAVETGYSIRLQFDPQETDFLYIMDRNLLIIVAKSTSFGFICGFQCKWIRKSDSWSWVI